MQQLQDLEPFSWINRHIDDLSLAGRYAYVSHVLPKGYPAYCKIFHPMFEDLSVQDRTLTWIEAEKRLLPPASLKDKRILWRELAQQYQLIFHAEFSTWSLPAWPNYVVHPDEGRLDETTCTELVKLLSPFTAEEPCYLCHACPTRRYGMAPYLLYTGTLETLLNPSIFEHEHPAMSYYWWIEDQSWCVYTDWDLSFTLVGGEERLIEALIASSILECIAVNESTRIDHQADQVNSPHK